MFGGGFVPMKTWLAFGISLAVLAGQALAWHATEAPVAVQDLSRIKWSSLDLSVSCVLGYYYLLGDCAYVTVVEGIEENETFGIHFNMSDSVAWYNACDTSACMTLDVIELVCYDVLCPPSDQSMNVKVYAADASGEPTGALLGNRDFEPEYTDTAAFSTIEIDFTNGGQEPGLDVSGCGGNLVVLLTWKNPTGHPCLVLDNVGTCVDSCAADPSCCEMGTDPYLYPRLRTHTYYYGLEWAWSKQDSFCDLGGCGTYGYLEALWMCGFCTKSTATEPTTWSGIKAMYR
jgi:hypothetical protein